MTYRARPILHAPKVYRVGLSDGRTLKVDADDEWKARERALQRSFQPGQPGAWVTSCER